MPSITHHFCRFGSRDVELRVGILLPVSEQEWKFGEESVVGVAKSGQRLRTGIAIEVALGILGRLDQVLPMFKVIWIGFLETQQLISTKPVEYEA